MESRVILSAFTYFEILNPSGSAKDSGQNKWLRFNSGTAQAGTTPTTAISRGYDRLAKGESKGQIDSICEHMLWLNMIG